jgi:hypothetical protein
MMSGLAVVCSQLLSMGLGPVRPLSSTSQAGMYQSVRLRFVIVFLLLGTGFVLCAAAQESSSTVTNPAAPLSVAQVVENLVQMNSIRAQGLRAYQGSRTYHIEYRGFPGTRTAEMAVSVKYRSPQSKEFTILSQAGSQLIIDRVFKKLLEAEQEALEAENQRRTALNSDNYDFTLVAYENTPASSTYVLALEPKIKSKFLYRGRIWVDGADFAVTRIEAEPSKSPSFWTKNAEIEQSYVKVDGFWLPKRNHSVSRIRLGGRAELTIDYTDYRITDANALSELRPSH